MIRWAKLIIYQFLPDRRSVPLRGGATYLRGGATFLRGGATFLRGGATFSVGDGTIP